jgi:hypothetical protein
LAPVLFKQLFWYFTYLFIRKKKHSIIQTFSIWKPQIEI